MEVIGVFVFLLLFLRSSMVLPHNVMVSPVVSDEGRCGLQKVLHVAAQLFSCRTEDSTGPRYCVSGFSEHGAEL